MVRAGRWSTLLHALGIHRPLRELTLWYFVGSFFNVILPTGFGGDAVRVAELAQDTHQVGRALNSVVVDRYLGIIVLLAMGLVAGILWPDAAPTGVLLMTAALFAAGLLAAWLLGRPWWPRLGEWPMRSKLRSASGQPSIRWPIWPPSPGGPGSTEHSGKMPLCRPG